MNTRLKLAILTLIYIAILTTCNCKVSKKKNFENGSVKQERIALEENKKVRISFSPVNKVIVEDILDPQVAVSPVLGKIILYGTYLSDSQKIILKVYNRELEFLSQKMFSIGQGPGDLGLVNVFTPVGDKFLVTENSNLRISTYDKDLNFLKTDKISMQKGFPFGLINEGSHYIGDSYSSEGNFSVATFKIVAFPRGEENAFWKSASLYSKYNKGRCVVDDEPHISYFWKNQTVYFLNMKGYQILMLNKDGELIRDVVVKFTPLKASAEKMEEYLVEQGYTSKTRIHFVLSNSVIPVSWMIPLKKGFVVLRRYDYRVGCNDMADGDYFSYDIEYLGKVKFPCFHWIFKLSADMVLGMRNCRYDEGYLYLVKEVDEELWLEKWEVKE